MELIKQGGRRGNKVKAFGCARLLNSRGTQRMLNRTVTHRARNKSGSNPLHLHTAVVYLMLRAVYNAVMARERAIQTSERGAGCETASHQLFAVNILETIAFPRQQRDHQMKQERKQILP